jgi:undecaprenyl-diphosphatase
VLTDHRRAIWWSLGLLAATIFVFVAVGRHPPSAAPLTSLPIVGRSDLGVYHWMDDIRNEPLTLVARFLSVLGGGVVTIPLRVLVAIWLAARRSWRMLGAWLLTWAGAEIILSGAKAFYHRGRPPGSLVETVGFSFPSGHAVAAAATAVALVLVLLKPGPQRRHWEIAAMIFAFVMAFSRVYLRAHWLSDVVAGVLLGTGVALGAAGFATEVRDIALRRRAASEVPTDPSPVPADLDPP